ncbi:MAG TPA: GNAT family N-acetyltransferase [Saprospiraceae bacterium]|nr:GNAT family N-acetyltransferase [Saprospiraceae bacterium]HMP23549.1 GNAT family N-acetyltransferase [Saprospiraceae bacterium]
MLRYKPIETDLELQQVLALQQQNLGVHLTPEEIATQGFLTVQHDYATLKEMNDLEQGIMATNGEEIAGYILAMTKDLRSAIPILVSMFDTFDAMEYAGRRLNTYRYIVVGQVCVAAGYRGQGLFEGMYDAYRRLLSPKYDFAITEISIRNLRSLRAHQRVGFQVVHEFVAPDGEAWQIVIWHW